MGFLKLFKELSRLDEDTNIIESKQLENTALIEKEKKPEEVLRQNDIKIKLITRTAFGIQIDLAKAYEEEKIKQVLSDFNVKIRDKSIFIVF